MSEPLFLNALNVRNETKKPCNAGDLYLRCCYDHIECSTSRCEKLRSGETGTHVKPEVTHNEFFSATASGVAKKNLWGCIE